jgi:hypothetical protein
MDLTSLSHIVKFQGKYIDSRKQSYATLLSFAGNKKSQLAAEGSLR